MFLSADRNCKPRENPNYCALTQQTTQVSLDEELQLYCSAGKGQHALPRVLLVPEMWNSTVKIKESVHRGLAQEFSEHEPVFFKEMC